MRPLELIAEDLAPGDESARRLDRSGLHIERIRSPDHPLFGRVYDRLWDEFGARGEIEKRDVIASRLAWDPDRPVDGQALLYEILAVTVGNEIVGLRDHTAILPRGGRAAGSAARVIVHLSHVVVEPPFRGSGLAGWLRALPLQTARACARAAGAAPVTEITLVAEMEPPDGTPAVTRRLRSYERAGFRAIDPTVVPYLQPDFRSASEIDASSPRLLPLGLVVRRVGRESEPTLPGSEVREIVAALYGMFGVHVAARHMAPLWKRLERLPQPADAVPLRPPLGREKPR